MLCSVRMHFCVLALTEGTLRTSKNSPEHDFPIIIILKHNYIKSRKRRAPAYSRCVRDNVVCCATSKSIVEIQFVGISRRCEWVGTAAAQLIWVEGAAAHLMWLGRAAADLILRQLWVVEFGGLKRLEDIAQLAEVVSRVVAFLVNL